MATDTNQHDRHDAIARMKRAVTRCTAVGAVLACVVIAACGSSPKSSPRYPTVVQDNFLSACTANGGSPTGCGCVLTEVENKLSIADYKRLEARIAVNADTGHPGQVLADAVAKCRTPTATAPQ